MEYNQTKGHVLAATDPNAVENAFAVNTEIGGAQPTSSIGAGHAQTSAAGPLS